MELNEKLINKIENDITKLAEEAGISPSHVRKNRIYEALEKVENAARAWEQFNQFVSLGKAGKLWKNFDLAYFLRATFVDSKNLYLLTDNRKNLMLKFPPDHDLYPIFKSELSEFLQLQIDSAFPELKKELSDNLYKILDVDTHLSPDQIDIVNIGYVNPKTGVFEATVGAYKLRLNVFGNHISVFAKRTNLRIEKIAIQILDTLNNKLGKEEIEDIGNIRSPKIISVRDDYGILSYIEGETLLEIGGNPLIEARHTAQTFDYDDIKIIAKELIKESALGFYLSMWSRHAGNLIYNSQDDTFTRIDFGQSFIADRNAYIEWARSIWYLRRFFWDGNRDLHYEDFRNEMRKTFIMLGNHIRKHKDSVMEILDRAEGVYATEFSEELGETASVGEDDLEKIRWALTAEETLPETVFDNFWWYFSEDDYEISNWSEFCNKTDYTMQDYLDSFFDRLPAYHPESPKYEEVKDTVKWLRKVIWGEN